MVMSLDIYSQKPVFNGIDINLHHSCGLYKRDLTQISTLQEHIMTKRFTTIYLLLAPLVFGLSWYISHRLYLRFMRLGASDYEHLANDRSLIYASVFTGLYLAAFFVIRDLYRPQRINNTK